MTPSIWQPIETAPKDGTNVLVTDGRLVWISSQRVGEYAGKPRNGMPTTGYMFYLKDNEWPIAWMPLPPPPGRTP